MEGWQVVHMYMYNIYHICMCSVLCQCRLQQEISLTQYVSIGCGADCLEKVRGSSARQSHVQASKAKVCIFFCNHIPKLGPVIIGTLKHISV